MAKRGHEIKIFTSSFNAEDTIEKVDGVEIYRFGTQLMLGSSNISLGLFYKIKSIEMDIIHSHFDIPPMPLAGARYAKKHHMPFILTYHGDWIDDFGSFGRRISVKSANAFLVNKILSSADIIISPSKRYLEESKFLSRYKERTRIIPNGICTSDFDIPLSKEECRAKLSLSTNNNILLFCGSLLPHKGPHILIKAMTKVIKKFKNTELLVVGQGEMKKDLILLAKKLDLIPNIRFIGSINNTFIKSLYFKSSDILILPSLYEVFGIVNLEAMASQLPIIASNVGGIPDIVNDGQNGILFPSGNVELLADAVIYLLSNESIRNDMGKIGKVMVKNYSWSNIAACTEEIYKDVLE